MADRDMVAEVRAAFAYHDAGMDPVTGCPMCRDDPEAEAQRWNWLRALVTRCREAEDTQQLLTECVAERDFNRHKRDEAEAGIAAIREAIHDEDRVVDDGLIKRVKDIIYDFSDLVEYSDRLETANAELAIERDRLTTEVERLKTEVSIAERYDREANAKMLARQCDLARQAETERDRLTAEHERLRNSEIVANDEVVRLRDFAVSLKTHNERQAARHEQDIEAAVRWTVHQYVPSGYPIPQRPSENEVVARYKAERQQKEAHNV